MAIDGQRAGADDGRPRPAGGSDRADRSAPGSAKRVLFAAVAVLLAASFAWGVARSRDQNQDPTASDQSAYIDYARHLAQVPGTMVGDRNRMPLYPWLLSGTIPDGADLGDAFAAGQRLSIAIAIAALIGLGAWSRTRLGNLGAAAFVTSAAAGIYVFKAPFVQTEPLFYLVFFGALVLMVRALARPGPLVGAAAGLAAGLAWLTKSSASLLIATFVVSLLVAGGRRALERQGGVRAVAGTGAAFAVMLVATVAPYATNSWRAYGSPGYNTNSSLYAWTDSWSESAALPLISASYIGPPSERPSPRHYIDHHDASDVIHRLVGGVADELRATFVRSIFGPLLVLQIGLALALVAAKPKTVVRWVRRAPELAWFATTTVAAYVLFIAWWAPQATGPRFAMTLYLPASAACLLVIRRLGSTVELGWARTDAATAAFTAIFVAAGAALAGAALVFTGSWYGGG